MPGLYGIPSEMLKLLSKYKLELLLSAFNACLIAGIFPSRWKGAMLVTISKGQSHPRGAVSVLYSRCVKHSAETA